MRDEQERQRIEDERLAEIARLEQEARDEEERLAEIARQE